MAARGTVSKGSSSKHRWSVGDKMIRVDAGDVIPQSEEIFDLPVLTKFQERRLVRQMNHGSTLRSRERAKDLMVKHNVKLVTREVARHILPPGTTVEDMFQVGAEGLLVALERFELNRDLKFSTYATFWIKQRIMRHLQDRTRPIRVPVHVHEAMHKVNQERRKALAAGEADEISVEEAARRISLADPKFNPDAAVRALALAAGTEVSTSLDASIRMTAQGADGAMWHEIVAGEDGVKEIEQIADDLEAMTQADVLRAAIDALPELQRNIVRSRYGFDARDAVEAENEAGSANVQNSTLVELGRRYKKSAECIRQNQIRAERKLKEAMALATTDGATLADLVSLTSSEGDVVEINEVADMTEKRDAAEAIETPQNREVAVAS